MQLYMSLKVRTYSTDRTPQLKKYHNAAHLSAAKTIFATLRVNTLNTECSFSKHEIVLLEYGCNYCFCIMFCLLHLTNFYRLI